MPTKRNRRPVRREKSGTGHLPNSSSVTEKRLADELEDLPFVKSVTSLSSVLPDGIPESFLPSGLTTQLHTDQYARMLIFLSTPGRNRLYL